MTLKDLIEIEKENIDIIFNNLNVPDVFIPDKETVYKEAIKEFLEQSITRVVTATIKDMMSNIPLTK